MPPSGSPRARQFRECVERGDLQSFEQIWLEAMESNPEDVDSFLSGIDALHVQGNLDKAGLYLSMLSPVLLERNLWTQALKVLRKMAQLTPRERGLRHGLLTAYRALLAEDQRLPVLLEKSGLESGQDLMGAIEKMDMFLGFQVGRYLFHPAGWGTGRISHVDASEASVIIDFEGRHGHRMSMEMAAKVTEFVEANDLRAMKYDRKDDLLRLAEDDPLELIRIALRSRRGKANLREIRDRLTAGVIDAKSWSRWWQKARVRIKGADDVVMTPGTNPTIELGAGRRGYPEGCRRDLVLIDGDEKQVRYFRDMMSEAETHDDAAQAVSAVAAALLGPNGDGAHLGLGSRISSAFLLQDARNRFPSADLPAGPNLPQLLSDSAQVIHSLAEIPISGHRLSTLALIKKAEPKEWPKLCQEIILLGEPDSADHCLNDLVRSGQSGAATLAVKTVADRYREYPLGFLWYLKAALGGRLPEAVTRERATSLFEKALLLHDYLAIAMLRDKGEDIRRASKALVNLFQGREYQFIKDAFAEATINEGSNLASILRNNRSIHRETWNHMLANMFRTRPELGRAEKTVEGQIPADPLFDPGVLYCTEEALLKKRMDFEDLVNRQIPENAAEIGRAASYGDLSENSEWSAAVEKQSRLTRQSEEMAAEMAKARIMDRSNVDVESVTLGSRVDVIAPDGQPMTYTILGPWEVDSDQGIISYLSPLGRSLMGRQAGAKVFVEARSGTLTYHISSISSSFA